MLAIYSRDSYRPSFTNELARGFGFLTTYHFHPTATTAGFGFAALLSPSQVAALRKERHVSELVPEGTMFNVQAGMPEAKSDAWWQTTASKLRLSIDATLPGFGLVRARLSARQLARVTRVADIGFVTAKPVYYVVDVRDGIDARTTAAQWRARGYPVDYAFERWFALNVPFEQVAALLADPDVASVVADTSVIHTDDFPQLQKPDVPVKPPRGCS